MSVRGGALHLAGWGAVLAMALGASSAQAQSLGYDTTGIGGSGASSGGASSGSGNSDGTGAGASEEAGGAASTKSGRKFEIMPYLELDQIVTAELSPGNDVLTYTQAVVGVDASIRGRRSGATVSARYAHQIGWGSKARDNDIISGLARGYMLVTSGLNIEAGGLVTQTNYSGRASNYVSGNSVQTIYSAYAGPTLFTHSGDIDIKANYRLGFTRSDQSNAYRVSTTSLSQDVRNDSVIQSGQFEAGVKPGVVAPVGLGVAGSYYQENITAFDQLVRDMQVRGLVTVPVSRTVQVVGALGYEDVEIGNRDVVYDTDGNPVVGKHGQYVVDKSSPRVLSYDVSGLLWDVAVMWRPSRRTSLTAHVGRRYGSTSFGGTLVYSPDDRKTLSVVVYDNVAGFGGEVNSALSSLSSDFVVVRDPVTGELTGCVNSLDGSNCLSSALGTLSSAAFRARGAAATYVMQIGRLSTGLAVGYDHRRYMGAEGTILETIDGAVDERIWVNAFLSGPLGRHARWSTNAYGNWISSTYSTYGDSASYGVSAAYYRYITPNLRGSLAVSIDGISYELVSVDDIWSATGLAGLRYNF